MKIQNKLLLILGLIPALNATALTVDFSSFDLEADSADYGPVPDGEVTETEDPYGPDSGVLITTNGIWDAPGGIALANNFNSLENPVGTVSYTFWSGWALSNIVDTTTEGYMNDGAAYPGGGSDIEGEAVAGDSYGVFFDGNAGTDAIVFPDGMIPQGFYVTNTTYAALAMKNGVSGFSEKFEQGDWFQLLIVGLDADGDVTGQIPFFLADFRDTDSADHYILDEWEWIDLRGMDDDTVAIQFYFYSSDTGDYGINTPTYVAVDNITATATAFAGAQPTALGWSVSPWFGAYYDANLPWIYSNDLGWIYMNSDSTADSCTFYSSLIGWVFTKATNYPWVYSYDSGTWLYYIKDTAEPWLFYDSSTGEIVEAATGSID